MRNRSSYLIFLPILLFSFFVMTASIVDADEKETLDTKISLHDSFPNTNANFIGTPKYDITNTTESQPDYIHFYAFNLFSPLNRTYQSRILPLNITFSAAMGSRYTLNYILDERFEGTIPFEIENSTELHVMYPAHGHLMLPELSEGNHNLTINMLAFSGYFTGSVQFTIDTQSQPDNIPEFPSWSILPVLLVAMMTASIYRNQLRKKKKAY